MSCCGGQPIATTHKPANGLGTYIEWRLKKMGITQDRYKALKAACGLPPRCNCDARKEWLNKAGRWISG